MTILLERFALWLRNTGQRGDVMSESRGGKEDRRLKKSFSAIYERGSEYINSSVFQEFLTSRELKVRGKSCNITGLQIADLIAHPSFKSMLVARGEAEVRSTFGERIIRTLEDTGKFLSDSHGRIDGYGRKWLP
ncbi:hypothetical protein J7K50_04400 [bacterium]|nr:hypothetical protein [bacterium]